MHLKARNAAYGGRDLLSFNEDDAEAAEGENDNDDPLPPLMNDTPSQSSLLLEQQQQSSEQDWLRLEVRPLISAEQAAALASPLDEVTGLVALGWAERLELTAGLKAEAARLEQSLTTATTTTPNTGKAAATAKTGQPDRAALLRLARLHARLAYFNGRRRLEHLEGFSQLVDDLELWLVRRRQGGHWVMEVEQRLRQALRLDLLLVIPGWEKVWALREEYRQRALLLGATELGGGGAVRLARSGSSEACETLAAAAASSPLLPSPPSLGGWEEAAAAQVPLFQRLVAAEGGEFELEVFLQHGLMWCHCLFDGWLEAAIPTALQSEHLAMAHYWQLALFNALLARHWQVPPLELRWPSRLQQRIPATWLVIPPQGGEEQRVRVAASHLIGAMRALVEEYQLLTSS